MRWKKYSKHSPKKIEGMEKLDYHQRLKECGLYSLERRRERYMIIYGWQQLENIKENVLELKVSNRSKTRRIQLGDIKTYLEDGTRINPSVTSWPFGPGLASGQADGQRVLQTL